MSLDISMKALLESGVHFGHRTNRWDPRMKPYIFTERNGIHIVDLQQTVECMHTAYDVVRNIVADGGTVLFVGTKRQAQETIQIEAERCGMPFVIERWLPGTLTNWMTIHQRIMELDRLEKMRDSGEIDRLVKKEGLMIERKIKRLLIHLSGIRHMKGVPELIFVVDIMREDTAVHEANLKNIPIVAMVDTNCNPDNIDYLIPGNDDAIRAIKLMTAKIADAVLEGKDLRKDDDFEEAMMASIPEGEGGERVRARVSLEEEVDDEDLLGESTLKKMAETRREEEEEAALEDAEETESADAGESDGEDVENAKTEDEGSDLDKSDDDAVAEIENEEPTLDESDDDDVAEIEDEELALDESDEDEDEE